jgi:hypothetical protein
MSKKKPTTIVSVLQGSVLGSPAELQAVADKCPAINLLINQVADQLGESILPPSLHGRERNDCTQAMAVALWSCVIALGQEQLLPLGLSAVADFLNVLKINGTAGWSTDGRALTNPAIRGNTI